MRLFVVGYPGDLGGACTELWHTLKLWRRYGMEVHLLPFGKPSPSWRSLVDHIGCVTHDVPPDRVQTIPELAGATVVSFCNSDFLTHSHRFRELDCRLVWVNCMTWLFDAEKKIYADSGLFDALVFQSEFQRAELEPQLAAFGYTCDRGHLIRGAFDFEEIEFAPRPHQSGDVFVIGRMARPDLDKWSSNTWPIYNAIQYADKRAIMLGVDDRVQQKLGPTPPFADCLRPMAIPVKQYLSNLHCLMPINGGARENWPRAGLEAMAAGVPVVAQNEWGWREMIVHGETGFLANNDCELAHFAALLAYDEDLRQTIINQAHQRLLDELANPEHIWAVWQRLFCELDADAHHSSGSYHQQMVAEEAHE
jgi:hypothetical protein